MKGVVLAAGIGKRMRPITDRVPKPMVPIANRPVLEHVLRGLASAGVDDVLVVVHYLRDQIEGYFGSGERVGVRLRYVEQGNPAGGTGAAALLAESFVGSEPFLLTFGDLLLTPANYRALVDSYRERPAAGRLMANWMGDPSAGAAVTIGDDERLVRIVEKPPRGSEESNWNNSGVFVFRPAIFDAIRQTPLSPRGELELTAAIQRLSETPEGVTVYRLEGLWSDVGTPAKVLELNRAVLQDPGLGVPVERGEAPLPEVALVDASSAVADGAYLEACRLEECSCVAAGARIGAGAVLRDSAVFGGGEVGAGCVLEHAIVTSGARVPQGQRVVGTPDDPVVVL